MCIRDSFEPFPADRIELALQVESDRMANCLFDPAEAESERTVIISEREGSENSYAYLLSEEVQALACLLYTSDAADERSSVDLGGRRIIKKKKK